MFLDANDALGELAGLSAASLENTDLLDLIEPDEREIIRQRLKLASSVDRNVQTEARLRNGAQRRVLLIARRTGATARSPLMVFFVNLREVTNLEDDRS